LATSFVFPDKTIADKKKDEQWHKDYLLAIMNESLGSTFTWFKFRARENYDYFSGDQDNSKFNAVVNPLGQEEQTASANENTLPAYWINYGRIKSKVHLLTGELIRRGFEIGVDIINKEAQTRKMEFKKQAIAKILNKDVLQKAQEITSIPVDLEGLPPTIDGLEDYMREKYKDNAALFIEYALKYNIELYRWTEKRMRLFRDVIVTGRCFVKHEMRNGYPQLQVCNPYTTGFDPYITDDHASDSNYFWNVDYMNIEDVVEQYGISKDEVSKLHEDWVNSADTLFWRGVMSDYGVMFSPFENINNKTRILVFKAQWMDTKKMKAKKSIDKFDNEHFKILPKDAKDKGEDIIEKSIKIRRQAVLIGGNIVKDYGEALNRPTDIDNPTETYLDYTAYLPDYINFKSKSMVDDLRGMQDLKNIVMYKIQWEVGKAKGRVVFINHSMIPADKGWDFNKVVEYLSTVGVSVYDDGADNMPPNRKPIDVADLGLSGDVRFYLELSAMLDREMDSITGLNEARQGQSQASTLVGVNNAQLVQSSTITEPLFEGFKIFEEMTMQKHADLIKIAWSMDKDKFSNILGELGFEHIKEEIDVELNDYGIFISTKPKLLQDENTIITLVNDAWRAGQLSPYEKIMLLELAMEKDTRQALRKLKKVFWDKEQRALQHEMEMQKAQSQGAQSEIEGKMQGRLAEINAMTQGQRAIVQDKASNDFNKTVFKENKKEEMFDKKLAAEGAMDAIDHSFQEKSINQS